MTAAGPSRHCGLGGTTH